MLVAIGSVCTKANAKFDFKEKENQEIKAVNNNKVATILFVLLLSSVGLNGWQYQRLTAAEKQLTIAKKQYEDFSKTLTSYVEKGEFVVDLKIVKGTDEDVVEGGQDNTVKEGENKKKKKTKNR